jgi:hypothetical protein
MAKRNSMTEAEWIVSENSYEMLQPCRRIIRTHPRKGHLFAVACCNRIWHLLSDKRSRAAVEMAARYADGLANETRRQAAEQAAQAAHADAFRKKEKAEASAEWAAQFAASSNSWFAATRASNYAFVGAGDELHLGPEHAAQARLLRCIFGPSPFRHPTSIDASWQSAGVVKLAREIYEQQSFEQLPALGDALENAGCYDSFILSHCRSAGAHVRGCWVIDLLLGKE